MSIQDHTLTNGAANAAASHPERQGAPAPRRRFAPEPIETITRSSRRSESSPWDSRSKSPVRASKTASQQNGASRPPRRFAPQFVEETHHSSQQDASAGKDSRKPRRFVPEFVEESTHSSHPQQDATDGDATPKPRRFAPQLVDETTHSSHQDASNGNDNRKPRRFTPQLLSTTSSTAGRRHGEEMSQSEERPRKRFTPQLVGTERRHSTSHGDLSSEHRHFARPTRPALRSRSTSPDEFSRFSYANLMKKKQESAVKKEEHFHPMLTAIESDSSEEELEEEEDKEAHRLAALWAARSLRRRFGRPSEPYRRESCDGAVSGYLLRLAQKAAQKQMEETALETFPSSQVHHNVSHYVTNSEDGSSRSELSCDENNGLLAEILDGIDIDIDNEIFGVAARFRRDSLEDLDAELAELRQSKEKCQWRRAKDRKDAAAADSSSAHESRFSAKAIEARRKKEEEEAKRIINAALQKEQQAGNLDRLKMIEPPMLGDDIVFPQCHSPRPTACCPDQLPRPGYFRLDDDERIKEDGAATPLWHRSPSSSPAKHSCQDSAGGIGGGLWNGMCKKHVDRTPSAVKHTKLGVFTPGVITPAAEGTDPFQCRQQPDQQLPLSCYSGFSNLPSTPPTSNPVTPPPEGLDPMDIDSDSKGTSTPNNKSQATKLGISHLDRHQPLHATVEDQENTISEEFPDTFVSQIYDYLSLGYPCLAHDFDLELSKISKLPIDALRQDDAHVDDKGYVAPPVPAPDPELTFYARQPRGLLAAKEREDAAVAEVDVDAMIKQGKCMRWCALRLYTREWARQQPKLLEEDRKEWIQMSMASAGPSRRGSWAV